MKVTTPNPIDRIGPKAQARKANTMGLRTCNWECIEGSPNWRIKSHMSMSKHSFLKHRVARLHLVCFPHSNLHYLHQWNSCSRRNKKTGMKLVNHHHLLHRWPVTGDRWPGQTYASFHWRNTWFEHPTSIQPLFITFWVCKWGMANDF